MTLLHLNERFLLELSEPRIKYRSVFVAEVSFMSGDADSYEEQEWLLRTQNDVIDFLMAIDDFYAMNQKYHRWDASDLSKDSYAYFGILTEEEFTREKAKEHKDQCYDVRYNESYAEYLEEVEIDWPRDHSCDDCGRAAFNGYKLYWYDESGKQSEIKVIEKARVL